VERDAWDGSRFGGIDSVFCAASGLTDSVAGPGGFEPERPAPSSSIAAMRAAFVGDGGSLVVAGEGGIDPPFFSRAGGFERGPEIGVPSGARRTT
jgi:hypothetical protein